MKLSLFYLPTIGSRAEIEAGSAGLRDDLYQRMLTELVEQAQLADELGYDSISFTEHHFHVEGFELSNNPVLLDLFVGLRTARIRVGQLGIVLPANNPIRVAEDIAMLDHMTGGRANAGFARGYQRRWVDIMAQQTHGVQGALPHQHDEVDRINREAFEECFQIIRKAWTQDYLEHQGRYWKIPAGETPWSLDTTAKWGGGVEDGLVRSVAVVPKPLQKPHPPIFQPFASSEQSIRWCAREGVTAILPPLHPKRERALFELYAEESGRPPGQGIAVLRDVVVAATDEEAQGLWRSSGAFCGGAWFEPFGFARGMSDPDTGEDNASLFDDGLALVGSVDTVRRQLATLTERLPVQWLFCWAYNGLLEHRVLLDTIERLAREVIELPPPADAPPRSRQERPASEQ